MHKRAALLVGAVAATAAIATGAFVLTAGGSDDDAGPARSSTTTDPPAGSTVTSQTTSPTSAPTTTTLDLESAEAPQPATTPDALADQIAAAERSVRDRTVPTETLAVAGHTLQVAYKKLALTPEWREEVLAGLPADLRDTADAASRAQAELRALVGAPRESLPDWHIVAPAPADELLGYYKAAEAEFGVPWPYLATIHMVETRMGRIRGTSDAGAQGPMQFMPSTWEAYGEGDINSNRDAIRAAARYLERNGAPDDMRNALWNYNHSYRYVDAVTLYAQQIAADERVFHGYYHFQVYYLTTTGDVWLPVGWTNE